MVPEMRYFKKWEQKFLQEGGEIPVLKWQGLCWYTFQYIRKRRRRNSWDYGKLAPSPSKQSDLLKVRSGRDSFRADEDIRGLSREWEIKRDTGTFKKVPMLWGWWYDGRSAGMRAYGRRDLHYFESLLKKCGHIA